MTQSTLLASIAHSEELLTQFIGTIDRTIPPSITRSEIIADRLGIPVRTVERWRARQGGK